MVDGGLEKQVQALNEQVQVIQEENKRTKSLFDKIQFQRHTTAVVLLLIGGLFVVFEGPSNKPSALAGSLILAGIIHIIGLAL
jgi:hypothetical protein